MIRVVIDTNVVVSSLLRTAVPRFIVDLALNRRFAWFVSEPIITEYRRVLSYPRLNLSASVTQRFMSTTRKHGRLVSPRFTLTEATDEPDNRFLECAQIAKANFLITGNLRHFPKTWKYTKVVAPADFWIYWQTQRPLDDK